MIDSRTAFLGCLFNLPLMTADAVVVLSGEDGEERLAFGVQAIKQGAAPVLVISGGVDSESQQSAKSLFPKALSHGVSHDRIILEEKSTNTREQAVNVVEIARKEGWKRLLLIVSPYHLPRVALTFIKALQEVGQEKEIRVVPISANQVSWFGKPRGQKRSRDELYAGEFAKIALYGNHVATYEEGIAYLEYWEGK